MSYDLGFWKYKDGKYADNQKVYEILSNEEYIDGLEELPIEDILTEIANVFGTWDKDSKYDFDSEYSGSFHIMTTSQFVRVDCYGMQEEDMNNFIDIMLEYDCPLYDPQVPQRYDMED